jgi:glutathione S-transferase
MQYLECKYPANPLFGRTPRETGAIWRVISEFGAYLHMPAFRVSGPFLFGKSEEKASDIRAALPEVHGELEKLEAAAANSAWLGGKAVTAADVAIYPVLMLLLRASAKKEAEPFKLGLLPFEDRYPRLGHGWSESRICLATTTPIRRTGGSKPTAARIFSCYLDRSGT